MEIRASLVVEVGAAAVAAVLVAMLAFGLRYKSGIVGKLIAITAGLLLAMLGFFAMVEFVLTRYEPNL